MNSDSKNKSYYKYWGKAEKDGSGYHLLPYHCLDVAALGSVLCDPQNDLCVSISANLGVNSEWFHDFFIFCLALHDLGKFARAFQGLCPGLSPDLVKPNKRMSYSERHDSLGFWLWRNVVCKELIKNDNNGWLKEVEPWLKVVTGHHGIPPKCNGINGNYFFDEEDEKAAIQFVGEIFDLFITDFDPSLLSYNTFKKRFKTVSWQLAGIAVLADWTGSNSKYFHYHHDHVGFKEYWTDIAIPAAQKACRSMPERVAVRPFSGIDSLFPFIKRSTPLQEYAENEPLGDGPQLFILEDVTGAGKTEAAVVLAHRLLSDGLADGFYVALPTMATANAMYERLGKVYRLLYDQKTLPSLILAHGARDFSDSFRQSVIIQENPSDELDYGKPDIEGLSASAYCNAWLADNRKKALLADVGVGTLDQALLAVLPARHQSLRLFGLRKKILLVDEVHAYDSYMQKLLTTLLEAHARQGGCVILLSATLPQKMRNDLIMAFHQGLDQDAPEIAIPHYPLATHTPASSRMETAIDTREEVKRSVTVVRLNTEEDVAAQIQNAVEKGKCVCWIRNTVTAARRSFNALSNCEWLDSASLHLFHSRFAMIDRQRIENDVLKRFGEKSGHTDRKGHVLIATQVVEQSLDLDFDVLVTDLAPVDLILQRSGRLCRHVRDADGNRISGDGIQDQRGIPTLYVFSPEPADDAEENWMKAHQKGTQFIYPHVGKLWLTANLLFPKGNAGSFTMPDDARELIEGVYSAESDCRVPENLQEKSFAAVGENQSRRSMADLNALKINKGYTRASGDWDEETRIPTRITEEESISVALANIKDGNLVPYAADAHNPWAMSVVKVPAWEWRKATVNIPDDIKRRCEVLKADIKALRWLEVFPLTDETQSYYNAANGWQPETGEDA